MIDLAEEIVPIGKKGWNTVAAQFAEWAKENGHPARTADSIERKFKQVIHMEKPTGQADCPSWLDHAHMIYRLMDEKVTTQDVDDEDIADDEPIELTDSNELEEEFMMALLERNPPRKVPVLKIKKEPTSLSLTVSRRAQTATLPHTQNSAGNEFLKSISNALDPRAHAFMTDERAMRSILNTQVLSLTNQLHHQEGCTEDLRNHISGLKCECTNLRKIDHLKLFKELQDASHPSHSARTPVQYKKRYCQDITYADGFATTWVGSGESDHQRDSPATRRYTHDYSPMLAQPAQPSPEKTATAAA